MSTTKSYPQVFSDEAPRMVRSAAQLLGVRELAGRADNPVIMAWASEVKHVLDLHDLGYVADSVPWCGLFMAVVALRAGWGADVPLRPLWARSWLEFGSAVDRPMLGDVLVFGRNGGGHVGVYVGEDATAYHVLGGNQGDAVTIARVLKNRLLGARRPEWRVAQPASVRTVLMGATGPLSSNEA